MVRVKSNLGDDIRRFVLPQNPTFQQLHDQLVKIYDVTDFIIKYTDNENDKVTVSSDDELNEAISSVGNGSDSTLLRIEVIRSGANTATPRNVAPAAEAVANLTPERTNSALAGPSSNPNPTVRNDNSQDNLGNDNTENNRERLTPEQVMQGLASVFAGMFSPFGMNGRNMRGMFPGGMFPGGMGMGGFGTGGFEAPGGFGSGMRGGFYGGMRGRGGRRGGRGRRGFGGFGGFGQNEQGGGNPFGGFGQPFGRQFGDFNMSDIARFIQDFEPQSIGGDFANIQQNTTDMFRNLVNHLLTQSNTGSMLAALPGVLPILHGFITELRTETPITQARIDALATAVNGALTSSLGAENARRVADFVRVAARDEAVLNILRRIPGGISVGMNMGNCMRDRRRGGSASDESMGRLDVHQRISCDECNAYPIVGVRYMCTNQVDFDLCARCFNDESVSKVGKTFRPVAYPWESQVNRPLVPSPTLSMGSRGVEVLFLQHVLTNLGYMTPADYRVRAGMFGPRTAAAINQFRIDCGLPVVGMHGVYDEILAASLLSLIDAGVPPTVATGSAAGSVTAGNNESVADNLDVDNSQAAA